MEIKCFGSLDLTKKNTLKLIYFFELKNLNG